jgi:hypothetical protein
MCQEIFIDFIDFMIVALESDPARRCTSGTGVEMVSASAAPKGPAWIGRTALCKGHSVLPLMLSPDHPLAVV